MAAYFAHRCACGERVVNDPKTKSYVHLSEKHRGVKASHKVTKVEPIRLGVA